MPPRIPAFIIALAACIACTRTQTSDIASQSEQARLPTGARLDPAGQSVPIGPLPLSLVSSPDGKHFVALLSGYRDNGVQVIDRGTGKVTQFLKQRAAFLGVAFSPDGKRLYASGGDDDAIYVYDWHQNNARIADTIVLERKQKGKASSRYPAGIAVSPDGQFLYAAENLGDSIAVIEVAGGKVKQRIATEKYPYAVVVASDGTVYASAWGGTTVSVFTPSNGTLTSAGRIPVGRHPSALLLNRDGSRLYAAQATVDRIAVVDTRLKQTIIQIADPSPSGPSEGSTPNALALSPDETQLYVAEADNNAVAVFDLTTNRLAGRIPVEWYPTGIYATRDSLFVANAKGKGTAANPAGPTPLKGRGGPLNYTLGQISGTFSMIALPKSSPDLAQLTARVARANGWDQPRQVASYPPIEHVIYIIKENRTYDQILGDLKQADGDTSLLFFPRANTPNHHALAERFGIFDRFFVNSEVSADGHNWSTAAYASDYVEKTVPLSYGDGGRTYDYEGTNRDKIPDDDVASPGSGYLWDLANKAGITYRNYGEFVDPLDFDKEGTKAPAYEANKPNLIDHTNRKFPGYSLQVRDQLRADVWIEELQQFERDGQMPQLEIMRLPNDHTSGASGGWPTPFAYLADNDLALGRIIEALSKTRFWASTAVFVLEDDAQNGSDHVDSHRSPMIVISPWTKGGVIHRFTNTTDVIATIEEILRLGTMSSFDHYSRPLRDIWAGKPDTRPYVALTPNVPLDQMNPKRGALAEESKKLALGKEDIADEDLFNRILWRQVKGESTPWPGVKRMSSIEIIDSNR